ISGWLITAGFILFTSQAFFFANHQIAGWFLSEPEAASIAASLIFIGGVFQLSDALQIIAGGSLRGLDDVKIPAWLAVFAYWIVSIPIGWVLAFHLGMGPEGMWWGITLGLTITAVLLGIRLWRKTRKPA
ncbi:MAG: MATE family efflux transporter, partial [Verrucomicrobiota bacterium]